MKIIQFRILIFITALFVNCSRHAPEPMWSSTHTVFLKEQLTIGTDDIVQDNYIFGNVTDIKTDIHGYIYVADAGLFRVQKYTSRGGFIRTIGCGNGREPGQFMRLMKIGVDSEGNVFTTDYNLRRITVFDSIGTVKRTIQVAMKPAQLIIGKDGFLYVIGNPMSYSGPIIHKYLPDGSFVKAFCSRKGIPDLVIKSGNFGRLLSDRDENIYYTLAYPYEIRKFSSDGVLLAKFTRRAPFFVSPIVVPVDGGGKKVWMESGTMDLMALPDGKLMHLIYERDRNRPELYPKLYFDILSQSGDWLLCLEFHKLGLKYYGALGMDQHGNLYVNHRKPYSKVTKYSFSIAEITKGN